eukprot:4796198-Alexandrium_andersonii.AAC.1
MAALLGLDSKWTSPCRPGSLRCTMSVLSSRPSRCQQPRSAARHAAAVALVACASQSEGALRSGARLLPASLVPLLSCRWVLLRPWRSVSMTPMILRALSIGLFSPLAAGASAAPRLS